MVRPYARTYRPDAATRPAYDDLYGAYRRLHDHFGRGGDDVMRDLRALRDRAVREAVPEASTVGSSGAGQWVRRV